MLINRSLYFWQLSYTQYLIVIECKFKFSVCYTYVRTYVFIECMRNVSAYWTSSAWLICVLPAKKKCCWPGLRFPITTSSYSKNAINTPISQCHPEALNKHSYISINMILRSIIDSYVCTCMAVVRWIDDVFALQIIKAVTVYLLFYTCILVFESIYFNRYSYIIILK